MLTQEEQNSYWRSISSLPLILLHFTLSWTIQELHALPKILWYNVSLYWLPMYRSMHSWCLLTINMEKTCQYLHLIESGLGIFLPLLSLVCKRQARRRAYNHWVEGLYEQGDHFRLLYFTLPYGPGQVWELGNLWEASFMSCLLQRKSVDFIRPLSVTPSYSSIILEFT